MERNSVRSNFDVPVSNSRCADKLDTREAPSGSWRTNITWNRGVRPASRSGATDATRRLNGSSAWENAPKARGRTWCSSARKVCPGANCERSTTVLRKHPTRRCVSLRVRPEIGVPTRMSAWPEYRCSRVAKAASRSMKGVACSFKPRARSRCSSDLGSAKCSVAPRNVSARGRGLSVGSASMDAAPASSFFQYAACSSSFPPWTRSRCQHAKSAYCTGSSGSGDGRFRENAA